MIYAALFLSLGLNVLMYFTLRKYEKKNKENKNR